MATWELRTESVVVRFDRPAGDAVALAITGVLDASVCRPFIAMFDDVLRYADVGCTVFWDVEGLERCDATVRAEITRVLAEHRDRVRSNAVLATSPLARMAAPFGVFALGNATIYRSRGPFAAARDAAFGTELRRAA